MQKPRATSVSEYLASLPPERRKELAAVRSVVKKHLPKGYEETLQYGMISYVVPLKTFPEGYLGKKDVPLPYVSLGAQKNYLSLYLLNVYGNADVERWFRSAYARSGKQLDMGKSCVRFHASSELALDVIGEVIAKTPVSAHVARYRAARGSTGRRATETQAPASVKGSGAKNPAPRAKRSRTSARAKRSRTSARG